MAGSAPADVEVSAGNGETPASPGAPTSAPALNHDELRAKLARDKKVSEAKRIKREAREAAERTRKEAEADRAKAAEERAKWATLGKDETWIAKIKAAGQDPLKVYEEFRAEALKAGTPDAKIDALSQQLAEEKAAREKLEKELADKEAAAKEERERLAAEREQHEENQRFSSDIQRALKETTYAPLLEEYEPEQLENMAEGFRREPARLFKHAKALGVRLTSDDGQFTMLDIFNTMLAAQTAHRERMQRRTQSAAPHTSATPEQGSSAKPTVNGTAERKAGTPTTLGNALASDRAAEKALLATMSKPERVKYLEKKYADAK
ncbi:MAG TPA: hypothetical protein VFN70_18205 [Burkholderiales bacterium]|nr:hypothetical protein [Burkholderiales bacterium]